MQTNYISRADIDPLTGFRFVAAMMVFFSHYAVPGVGGTAERMMQSGYAGVTLFFVLSGFVITYNYLEQFEARADGQTLVRFLVARFARVYPLYLFFIVFGWLMEGSDAVPWAHLLAIQAWSPDSEFAFSLNGPAWSIGVEVFLYLVFPLLVPIAATCGVLSSFRKLLAAGLAVALAMLCAAAWFRWTGLDNLPYADPMSAYRWLWRTPVARLGDFLLGLFGVVYFLRFAKMDAASVRRWGHVTVLGALAVLVLLGNRRVFHSTYSWDVAYALPAVLLIVGLAINRTTVISRVLSSAPLILLGQASYALYLVHVPARPMLPSIPVGGIGHQLAVYAMFMAWVIAVSIGLHIAIEKPARRWIRALLSPRGKTLAVAPDRPIPKPSAQAGRAGVHPPPPGAAG